MNPRVTVLMPVYNGEKYLREAIDSILNQSFSDFEILAINDGSTDGSLEILQSYHDPRIRLVQNEKNLGLIATLNKGLELAHGEYIARMDADDISLPERLAKQVKFMDGNPEVGIAGSWMKTIGSQPDQLWRYPTDFDHIRCRLFFESGLAHPTVIMRKSLLQKNGLSYDAGYRHAEDYELWYRAAKRMVLANIGEVLLLYRLHSRQASQYFNEEKLVSARKIWLAQLADLGIAPTAQELDLHQSLNRMAYQPEKMYVEQIEGWLNKVTDANKRTSVYPEPAFSNLLFERWFAVCMNAQSLRIWALRKLMRSPLSRVKSFTFGKKLRISLDFLL